MTNSLRDMLNKFESQAEEFAEKENFEFAAASLKSAEIISDLINIQKALNLSDLKIINEFLNNDK